MSRRKQRLTEVVPKLRHIYAYFWPQIRRYRGLIAASLATLMGSVAFRLLEPWPLKVFLDYVLADATGGATPKLTGFLHERLQPLSPNMVLLLIAVAMVAIVALRAFSDYLSNLGFFLVGNRVVVRVRDKLYRHLQELSVAYHTRARTGDLVIRVTRDVNLLRDVTATAMLPLIASSAVLVGMLAVMMVMNWRLTLLALVTMPLFWLTTRRLGKQIRESARRQRQREGAMATTAAETMSAIGVIKAMGLEDRFSRAFSQRNSSGQKEDFKASRLSVRLSRSVDILLAVSSAIVLWFGGKSVLAGDMSPGDIVIFLTYLKRSFKPAQNFAKYTARLAKAAAAGERVIEVLEQSPDVQDAKHAVAAPDFVGAIEFDDLHFGFQANRPVLQGLTFSCQPGELVCLVGPSGGGKSTLLGHLLRLYAPDRGTIRMDGVDIRSYTARSLRRRTSSVMQEAVLLAESVSENIACSVDAASADEVREAAQLANAHEFIVRLPGEYEARLGERGANLSRGQRQRIAIARAAIRRSPILLLDEPTTGLDEDNESAVVDALLRLASGRTTLLVTHNLALARKADRILFLDAGRIVEQGTHAELVAKKGRYARWFHDQSRKHGKPESRLSVVS